MTLHYTDIYIYTIMTLHYTYIYIYMYTYASVSVYTYRYIYMCTVPAQLNAPEGDEVVRHGMMKTKITFNYVRQVTERYLDWVTIYD